MEPETSTRIGVEETLYRAQINSGRTKEEISTD